MSLPVGSRVDVYRVGGFDDVHVTLPDGTVILFDVRMPTTGRPVDVVVASLCRTFTPAPNEDSTP